MAFLLKNDPTTLFRIARLIRLGGESIAKASLNGRPHICSLHHQFPVQGTFVDLQYGQNPKRGELPMARVKFRESGMEARTHQPYNTGG